MTIGTLVAPTTLLPDIDVVVGTWLQDETQSKLGNPIEWCPHGRRRSAETVRNVEHLSVLVSRLPIPGEWGLVQWQVGDVRRWCQTMRHRDGWVVDAHDGTSGDFAKRVYRGEIGDYPKPAGNRPAYPFELWSPMAAADLMWAWLHGALPEGYARTMRHMVNRIFDHGM